MKFQYNPAAAFCLHSHTVLGHRVARIASILATRNLALTGIANSQSSALLRKLALLSEIMAESKHSSSLPWLYHQKKLSFKSLSYQTEHIFPGMSVYFQGDRQDRTKGATPFKLVSLKITTEREAVQRVARRHLTRPQELACMEKEAGSIYFQWHPG